MIEFKDENGQVLIVDITDLSLITYEQSSDTTSFILKNSNVSFTAYGNFYELIKTELEKKKKELESKLKKKKGKLC